MSRIIRRVVFANRERRKQKKTALDFKKRAKTTAVAVHDFSIVSPTIPKLKVFTSFLL